MKNPNALAVMVKAPVPGQVKTRLAPPLSDVEAAGFYRCLIVDTFTRISLVKGVDLFAVCTPPDARSSIREIIPSGVLTIPQKGEELGARLNNLFTELFDRGYRSVAVMGSDSPDLPVEFIDNGFEFLKREAASRVVLGPAADGGYYIIGMNKPLPELFEGIAWSTERVFDETQERARKSGATLKILPLWYDIDTPHDLARLINNPYAPQSSGFLTRARMFERYKLT